EKAIALLHLEDHERAIRAADQGLAVFDSPTTIDSPPAVRTNIGESLYRAKAVALRESGQAPSGRRVLEEGLGRFPGSEYLTQIVDRSLPDLCPARCASPRPSSRQPRKRAVAAEVGIAEAGQAVAEAVGERHEQAVVGQPLELEGAAHAEAETAAD